MVEWLIEKYTYKYNFLNRSFGVSEFNYIHSGSCGLNEQEMAGTYDFREQLDVFSRQALFELTVSLLGKEFSKNFLW